MIEIDRFNWNLARVFYGISCVSAVIGIICNVFLFVTTVRTRTMRTTCNILIAICALADCFHQFGTLVQFPLLFGFHVEMDSDQCLILMYLPEMGVATGVAVIFAVGLDRMLSVLISGFHRLFIKRLYHCFLALFVIGYCASFSYLIAAYYRKRVVICGMLSPYPDFSVVWFRVINLVANGATALVYTITWIGLQVYKDAPGMKRIIKSLFYIAAADVCGWILTPVFIQLIQHFNFNDSQIFAWTYFGTIFINLAMSTKLLIYYSTSSEYRQAISGMFVQ